MKPRTMPMRRLAWSACALLAGTAAVAQDGLRTPEETPWPRWQARVGLLGEALRPGAAMPFDGATPLQGAQLFGDYYMFDLPSTPFGLAGGLRATSGLTVGARGLATGMPPLAGGHGLAWRAARLPTQPHLDADTASLPYVGLGFTGLSRRGGWGVSADIGLAGYAASGNGLRLNAARADASTVDEVLRDLRLTPVLQLGVSYSF